ncbi:MAG: hypothetical protein QNJ40_20360 [Xanthomonadales bacterium]|nr:hypothetical protein [Xanthomonadales bacterium]
MANGIRANGFRILKAAAGLCSLFLVACASTPHGNMMMSTLDAPDLETGKGCAAFGVAEVPELAVATEKLRFDANFVQPWEIERYCPSSAEHGAVWGCYHEDTGQAYLVGKDWKVYWHEWCHAKMGPAHTSIASRSGSGIGGYTQYIAMAQRQQVTTSP